MERGTAFSHVEDVIDTAPLSELHKAALWLLAWSLRDVEQQRQDARLTLAAVGAGEMGRPVMQRARARERANEALGAASGRERVVCPQTHSNSTSAVFRSPSGRLRPTSARDGS